MDRRGLPVEGVQAAGLAQVNLLQGAGGVSKSVLLKAMAREMIDLQLGSMIITAWVGVASAPFGSPTLCRLLKINHKHLRKIRNATEDEVNALRSDFAQAACDPEDLAVLVIDECSFLIPEIICHVDIQLRRLCDRPDTPFGGVILLLVGDFWQKSPPGGVSMAEQLVAQEVPGLAKLAAPLDPTTPGAKG